MLQGPLTPDTSQPEHPDKELMKRAQKPEVGTSTQAAGATPSMGPLGSRQVRGPALSRQGRVSDLPSHLQVSLPDAVMGSAPWRLAPSPLWMQGAAGSFSRNLGVSEEKPPGLH